MPVLALRRIAEQTFCRCHLCSDCFDYCILNLYIHKNLSLSSVATETGADESLTVIVYDFPSLFHAEKQFRRYHDTETIAAILPGSSTWLKPAELNRSFPSVKHLFAERKSQPR